MQIGLGLLGLPSEKFWALTPKELASAAIGITGGNAATSINRAEFDQLVNQFPDEVKHG